jgi:hypothetical protein
LPRELTDCDDKYRLQTDDQKPGAFVGKYRVTLEDMAIYSAPRDPDGTVTKLPPTRISAQLTDPMRNTITKEVILGPQTIDLKVAQ